MIKKKHDDETRTSGEASVGRYNELMSKIAEDEELVEGTEMDAQDLLGTVGIQLVGRSAMSDLMTLRNQVKEFEALGEKKKAHEEMRKTFESRGDRGPRREGKGPREFKGPRKGPHGEKGPKEGPKEGCDAPAPAPEAK